MSDITRKLAVVSCFLFTSFCFWKVGVGLTGGTDTEILSSAQAAMSPSLSPPPVVTTPIHEMRPGMRVVGRNPLRIETEATIDPTPAGWRLVSVRMRKEDGSYFEAELLRPLSWIYRHRAQPGAVIQLNMPEIYVVGAAEVLSISACPPIDPGDGPVVLSTFKNTADNILNIYVEGETEPIGVTAGHPIWSEDRQAFVHSEKLQLGERLRSALGKTVRITSIEIRAGPEPVYNLEVAGEHVYSVTDSGLLVHNTTPCQKVAQNVDTVGVTTRALGPRTLLQQRELARLTSEVREELVNNFDALARELSPGQIRAIADEPWSMKLFFGTALEGRVAARVRQTVQDNADSVLSDIRWTGRTNAPQDFIGPGQHGFDITGGSASSIRKHFTRPEVDAVITYESIPSDLGYRFIKWFGTQ